MEEEYDSQSIKVMKEDEMTTFPWYLIEVLAERYTAPLEVVKRGVETAYQAGVDVSYYEDRYLKGDRSIPENETFTNTYREMLIKDRNVRWMS
jgi:hypothetical protein